MKFLSENGLSHLMDKIKSVFATKTELRERTKKKVEPVVCIRKAIRISDPGNNVGYYHQSLYNVMIALHSYRGRFHFKFDLINKERSFKIENCIRYINK